MPSSAPTSVTMCFRVPVAMRERLEAVVAHDLRARGGKQEFDLDEVNLSNYIRDLLFEYVEDYERQVEEECGLKPGEGEGENLLAAELGQLRVSQLERKLQDVRGKGNVRASTAPSRPTPGRRR